MMDGLVDTNFPRSVMVLGVVYDVEFVQELERDGAFLFGYADHIQQRIFIHHDMTHVKKVQTLMHETLHVLWHLTGQSRTDDIEEPIITMLGCLLPTLFNDNPKLTAILTGQELNPDNGVSTDSM